MIPGYYDSPKVRENPYTTVTDNDSLREPVPGLKGKHRDRTPAMALGLTDRVWTVGDLLRTPLTPVAA